MPSKNLIRASIFLVYLACSLPILAQTTAITYQGKLTDAGNPANGQYDFVFRVFDSSGSQIGGDLEKGDVQVTGGIFTVSLNFGLSPFAAGAADSLEIGVRPGTSTGPYTNLAPRQALASSPFTIRSLSAIAADSASDSAKLGGVAANQFVVTTDPRMTDPRTPLAGSADYVQNRTNQQAATNFNISGRGTANSFEAISRFELNGQTIMSAQGTNNLAVGLQAATGPGQNNSAFGFLAGQGVVGSGNSFFGTQSGANSSGFNNSFFGFGAGNGAGGSSDTIVGSFSGNALGSSSNVSILGSNALVIPNTGNQTLVGAQTIADRDSTAIGAFAQAGVINSTAVGARATVTQSNALVLGAINGVNGAAADTNVGIGTTAPATRLHVSGTGIIRARINSDSNAGVALTLSDQPGWSVATANTGHFQIFNDAVGSNAVWIDKTNNNVGIGSTSPGQKLDVLGDVRIGTGTTGCITDRDGTIIAGTCSSDSRFKKNVLPFGRVLGQFANLRPVYFDWRSDEFKEKHFGSGRSFGLIAQEVEKLFPELVVIDENGYKAVKYSELPLLTIQAIKEQQSQIEQQQKKLEAQQKQIEELKLMICAAHPQRCARTTVRTKRS